MEFGMGLGRKTKNASAIYRKRNNQSATNNDGRVRKRFHVDKDHEKQRNRVANACRMALLRSQESVEEYEARISASASRMALLRSRESAERRELILDRQNTLRTAQRLNETISERQTRLQKQKIYNQNYRKKLRQFEPPVTPNPQHRKWKLEKNKEAVDATAEPVSTEDDCAFFCTNLKVQMRNLEVEQKYICQKLISDAIFLARTCQLNLTSRIQTEISQPTSIRVSDSLPDPSSNLMPSAIPNVSLHGSGTPDESYLYNDPLDVGYKSEELDDVTDSDTDTKDGIIGNL